MSADSMAQIGPTARLVCSVPGSRRSLNGALTRRRVDVDQVFSELPASGGFPNPAALLRLAGAVVVEAHDEWRVSARLHLPAGRHRFP